jgi:hypothetical protein
MAEQLANRDAGRKVPIGVVRPVSRYWMIECDFALPNQLKNRDSREHLVHGTQAELGVDGVSNLPGVVGHTPGLSEENLAVVGNEDRPREGVRSTHRLHVFPDSGGKILVAGSSSIRALWRRNWMAHHASDHWRVRCCKVQGRFGKASPAFFHEDHDVCPGIFLDLEDRHSSGHLPQPQVT